MSRPQLAWILLCATAACGPSNGGMTTNPCNANLFAGDLVFTEVFPDADGADEGKEWFEIYNATSQSIDMDGVLLIASKDTGEDATSHTMSSQIIDAGDYLVLGGVAQELRPAWVDYGYGPDLRVGSSRGLPNADGRLAMTCGDVTVDEMTYGVSTSGKSLELDGTRTPDYNQNDDRTLWCDAPTTSQFTTAGYGTPGAVNDPCANVSPTQCNDGGTVRDIVAPQLGDLVISEVMANPGAVADADGEWIEIAVLKDVDLNGLQLGKAAAATGVASVSETLTSADCLHYTAGSYVVLAANTDAGANGGLPTVDFPLGFGLTNTNGGVYIGYSDTPLDVVTWTSATSDKATNLDKISLDPALNDDLTYWCPATSTYGTSGMLGTPGAENIYCSIPNMCLDGATRRAVVPPTTGQIAINEWMANPSGVDGSQEYVELLAKASFDLNGLELGVPDGSVAPPVKETVSSPDCMAVTNGQRVLLADSTDEGVNGGIPAANIDYSLDFTLGNSTGGIFVGTGGAVLDSRTWTNAPDSESCQINPADGTPCVPPASQTYGNGANTGTPAAMNVCDTNLSNAGCLP